MLKKILSASCAVLVLACAASETFAQTTPPGGAGGTPPGGATPPVRSLDVTITAKRLPERFFETTAQNITMEYDAVKKETDKEVEIKFSGTSEAALFLEADTNAGGLVNTTDPTKKVRADLFLVEKGTTGGFTPEPSMIGTDGKFASHGMANITPTAKKIGVLGAGVTPTLGFKVALTTMDRAPEGMYKATLRFTLQNK